MISEQANEFDQKHAALKKPLLGEFGRNEIAILGTNCNLIRSLASGLIKKLSPEISMAYVDADHKSADNENSSATILQEGASLEYTDKILFQRIDTTATVNKFQRQALFNQQELVLVNGNHFTANTQILVIDPAKSVEKKLDKLTNVQLIVLLKDAVIPVYVTSHLNLNSIPVCSIDDHNALITFCKSFLQRQRPVLKALVLAGGKSSRMKTDKGSINYRGVSQREYLYSMLSNYCKTYISANQVQAPELKTKFDVIEDAFINLGPVGGILSALQMDPNAAWLTIACDLPYLSENTIKYLIDHRNSAKTATAFLDPKGEFPEPLITIWEPRSYPVLLQFLALGYSCPRKVLINSNIELLNAPDASEFANVNYPDQYEQALQDIRLAKK